MNVGDIMNVATSTTLWQRNRCDDERFQHATRVAIVDPDEIVIIVKLDVLCPDEVCVLSPLGSGWIQVVRLKSLS